MTSFNDGIEAAAQHIIRGWFDHHTDSVRFTAREIVHSIRALKRPEPSEAERMPWPVISTLEAAGAEIPPKAHPSEAEKVERVAAYMMGQCDPVWAADEWEIANEEIKDKWRDRARAALAAAGGEA